MAQTSLPTNVLEKTRSLSSTSSEEVRTISISEYEQAAQCLSEAFAVDEVSRYFVDTPDMLTWSEEEKYKLHCDIMRYLTAAHVYKGVVTTIGPDYDAVALWTNIDSLWTFLRSGLWRLYYKLSPEGRARFFTEFFPLLHDTKHSVMGPRDDDSYYLVYLGSKPGARGKGYARKLVEDMLVKANRENRAVYLESSAENNLTYYGRWGFEHISDIELKRAEKGIKLHIMVREPQCEAGRSGELAKGKGDVSVGVKAVE